MRGDPAHCGYVSLTQGRALPSHFFVRRRVKSGEDLVHQIVNSSTDNSEATQPSADLSGTPHAKARGRRKGQGRSEKVRQLAALSLASKIGYLMLDDILEPEDSKVIAPVKESLATRFFPAGSLVHPTEDSHHSLMILKSGSVEIFRVSPAGHRFPVKTIEAGTIFGEMPLVGQAMLGARAQAAEPSYIVFLEEADVGAVAAASPDITLRMMRKLGVKLIQTHKQHEEAAFQVVTARVASLLLERAGTNNRVTGLTHGDIAETLGVYRETVTNSIAELKRLGLIEVGRMKIQLLDREALVRLSSPLV